MDKDTGRQAQLHRWRRLPSWWLIMGMFESLAHYFIKPVLLWLLAIFIVQAFFFPMATTWAGDMLAMFWTQAVDEAKDLFW